MAKERSASRATSAQRRAKRPAAQRPADRPADPDAVAARRDKVQAALYQIADAASAAQDMQEFYAASHRIVGELMYADNFFIALYDEQTDLITWPYYVDTIDVEPPPPTGLQDHRGATGWVLRHGKTIADTDGSWAAAQARGEGQDVGSRSV